VLWDVIQLAERQQVQIPPEVKEKLVKIALQAIESEAPLRERAELGLALGHLGDPRVVEDLRSGEGFVEIRAGRYIVGEEESRRTVEMTQGFRLSRYPVTNSQYAVFKRERGYEDAMADRPKWWSEEGAKWARKEKRTKPEYWDEAALNAPNQPVVGVSWYEAEAFCRWVGGSLPTADQSEAAARGPQASLYPWGDDWFDGICNSRDAQLDCTSAVGLFPRSRSRDYGLEDSAGNVWEWCADAQPGAAGQRVVRGGSWDFGGRSVRAACRSFGEPSGVGDSLGFRCRVQ